MLPFMANSLKSWRNFPILI